MTVEPDPDASARLAAAAPDPVAPEEALELLKEGNRRFVGRLAGEGGSGGASDQPAGAGAPDRTRKPAPARQWDSLDLAARVRATSDAQHPFAVVLGCIDSRVPPEVVFDQGLGDIFTVRVAGNVVGPDQLGSLEFACKLAGARLVLVLGHTRCAAVVGALEGRELGHLTGLLEKIRPATELDDIGEPSSRAALASEDGADAATSNAQVVARVAEANVRLVVERIRRESAVLAEMEAAGEIVIVGAMYHVETGTVRIL